MAYSNNPETSTILPKQSLKKYEKRLPGPQSYNVQTTYLSKMNRHPAFSLGLKNKKSSLYEGFDLEVPGPGKY